MSKKSIGLSSAIFLSVSSILGSGWLFSAYKSSQVAGPAALISWIIGAILFILLAMCFSEVAALYPRRGLTAIIPTLSHNRYFGFPFAIANWLGIVAVIALEADATIQYLINISPSLEPLLFSNHHLTIVGNSLSISLVLLFCLANYWGAKTLIKSNNIFAILKIIIPLITALIIISAAFHPKNFTSFNNSFMPYGLNSIFTAILTSGIIVAFNGFQTIIAFASEIKKPHKTIPLALLISILICLAVYLLLQIAYIGGIPEATIQLGWHKLFFTAPMVELSTMLGLGLLTSIIYFGATIAPSGTAIAFTGTATRMFTAMSRNKQMPKMFDKVNEKYKISRPSLLVNTALSIVFLLLFDNWSQLAIVLGVLHLIAYLPIPIALIVLRRNISPSKYLFRIPFGHFIALMLFVIFTMLFTMADVHAISNILIIFSLIQAVFISLNINSFTSLLHALKQCYLLIVYFSTLFVLTYLSPNNSGILSIQYAIIIKLLFSILAFYVLTRSERNDVDVITSGVKIFEQ